MASFLRLWFSGGSLHAEGDGGALDLLVFDPRTRGYGAPARQYAAILAQAAAARVVVDDEIAPLLAHQEGEWSLPPPAAVALDLLHALDVAGGQGLLVIADEPTRREIGLLALGSVGTPALLIAATRASVETWGAAVAQVFSGPRGALGGVTVAQADAAPELLRRLGHRFGLIVVDEASGAPPALLEALEAAVAPLRVGLAASSPADPTALGQAIGPVVGEVRQEGSARRLRLRLALGSDEREARARALDEIAAGGGEEVWRRLAWIEGFSREARSLARLLLGRHREESIAIEPGLALRAAGAGLPELLAALVAEVPPASRGEVLSLARTGRLTLATTHASAGDQVNPGDSTAPADPTDPTDEAGATGVKEAADPGIAVRVVLGPAAAGDVQKGTVIVYEIGYIEAPCWGAGAWQAEVDDRENGAARAGAGQGGDGHLPGKLGDVLPRPLRRDAGAGAAGADAQGEALGQGARDRPAGGGADHREIAG